MPTKSPLPSRNNPKLQPSPKTHSHKNNRKAIKQPISESEQLKRLFTSLCAQIDGAHFTNALKTCDKILRIDPNDQDALQTKLFVLLQTEQYEPALSLIGTSSKYAFERKYSLYRLQHEQEAFEGLTVLKETSNEQNERGILHLEAQLHYRQGSYQTAFDLYNQLLDTAEPQSEEHSDILINLAASQKHLDFINADFLHALDALPTSIITNIETKPPPSQTLTTSAVVPASPSTAANVNNPTTTAAQPAKKVRMSRVPKGVTPGVTPPPDPERWLKKSERSTFGQGRKRRGAGGGGTQGSTVETAGTSGAPAAGVSSHNGKSGKGKKKK